MWRALLRENLSHVGSALREPEAFVWRWHRERRPYPSSVWIALAGTAIFGTLTYGMTMGIHSGLAAIVSKGVKLDDRRRPGLGDSAAGALYPQQPGRLSAASQHDAVGSAGHDELGRPGARGVDTRSIGFSVSPPVLAVPTCSAPAPRIGLVRVVNFWCSSASESRWSTSLAVSWNRWNQRREIRRLVPDLGRRDRRATGLSLQSLSAGLTAAEHGIRNHER